MHEMCGLAQVDAIVFLVDAIDRARFPESKRELDGLLADEALAKVPPPPPPPNTHTWHTPYNVSCRQGRQ